MKRYITITVAVLAAFAWLLFSRMEIFNSDKHFAIDDADAVTRIELSAGEGRTILSKSNEQWYVYDAPANHEAIKKLLRVLTDIDTEYPMPKVHENRFAEISRKTGGLHVLVYEEEDCVRNFYLMFPDVPGCIGLLDGKKQVYCLKVQGLDDKSVAESMNVEPEYWRRNVLFDLRPDEILSISIRNGENPEESFNMTRSDTAISITDIDGSPRPFDKEAAGRYLSYFMNVTFERYADLSDEKRRNLMLSEPSYVLTIETDEGRRSYKAIHIAEPDKMDDYGNPVVYNRDYFYLVLPDEKVVRAKWLNFDVLFKKPAESTRP